MEKDKDVAKSEKIRKNLIHLLFATVGALIAAGSFILHYNAGRVWVTAVICVVDLVYAYFNASIFFEDKSWGIAKPIAIAFFLFIYWIMIFAIVAIGAAMADAGSSDRFFLYPVFLMPAFVLMLIVILFFAQGL